MYVVAFASERQHYRRSGTRATAAPGESATTRMDAVKWLAAGAFAWGRVGGIRSYLATLTRDEMHAFHSGGGQASHFFDPGGPWPVMQAPPQAMTRVFSGILTYSTGPSRSGWQLSSM